MLCLGTPRDPKNRAGADGQGQSTAEGHLSSEQTAGFHSTGPTPGATRHTQAAPKESAPKAGVISSVFYVFIPHGFGKCKGKMGGAKGIFRKSRGFRAAARFSPHSRPSLSDTN
jgi:hypothetical protein